MSAVGKFGSCASLPSSNRSSLAGKMNSECGAGRLKQAGHGERKGVRNFGVFSLAFANEVAKMSGLVIEAAGSVWLIKLDGAPIDILDRGAGGVPPVFMDGDESAGSRKQGIAAA